MLLLYLRARRESLSIVPPPYFVCLVRGRGGCRKVYISSESKLNQTSTSNQNDPQIYANERDSTSYRMCGYIRYSDERVRYGVGKHQIRFEAGKEKRWLLKGMCEVLAIFLW